MLTANAGMFVAPAAGNLHVRANAIAAIDAGTVAAATASDWDGETRPRAQRRTSVRTSSRRRDGAAHVSASAARGPDQRRGGECGRDGLGVDDLPRLRPRRSNQRRPSRRQLGRRWRLERRHAGQLPRLAAGRFRRHQDHQRGPRLQRPGQLHQSGRADRDADLQPVRPHQLHGAVLGRRAVADRARRHDHRQPDVWRTVTFPAVSHHPDPDPDHRRQRQLQPPRRGRGLWRPRRWSRLAVNVAAASAGARPRRRRPSPATAPPARSTATDEAPTGARAAAGTTPRRAASPTGCRSISPAPRPSARSASSASRTTTPIRSSRPRRKPSACTASPASPCSTGMARSG